MTQQGPIETLVIGSTGYVAGELFRLLESHPVLKLTAALSRSRNGDSLSDIFPHLHGTHEGITVGPIDSAREHLSDSGPLAVFSALPHTHSANHIDALLTAADTSSRDLFCVDLSADFRLRNAMEFADVYNTTHPAPNRFDDFHFGLPDLSADTKLRAVAQPGCFTTAVTLGAAGLVQADLNSGPISVAAVTGSTGSGRTPTAGTHHPESHGGFRAYKPLDHRHTHEMRRLLKDISPHNAEPILRFVPHSGPFARGIHATLFATLKEAMNADDLANALGEVFANSPFVTVQTGPVSLKDVVGTNYCRIGVETKGTEAVVFSCIDNLTKGSAGGAIQWMNRLIGVDPTTGLTQPALGWN